MAAAMLLSVVFMSYKSFLIELYPKWNSSFPGILFEVGEAHVDFRECLRLRVHVGAHVVVQEATGNKAHEHDQFGLVLPRRSNIRGL